MPPAPVTSTPFRELLVRPKAALPKWTPSKEEEVKYALKLCRGVPRDPTRDEAVLTDLIDTFETRDDDVFVCTFVKSGTTWTQQIVALLLNGGDQGEKCYREVVPWLEAAYLGGFLSKMEAKGWTPAKIVANPERRFFKTHASLDDLPSGKAPGVKVIYVCRNPKDVCVSLQHHSKDKDVFQYEGEFSDMLRFFAEGRALGGSWFNHVLPWYEASKADPEHILFMRYEEMITDTPAAVKKIADFVGIETTPEIVKKVVEGSTVSVMKRNANAFGPLYVNHVRKGEKGGWRDYFTVRQSEQFDVIYRQQMAGSGLKMDFGGGVEM